MKKLHVLFQFYDVPSHWQLKPLVLTLIEALKQEGLVAQSKKIVLCISCASPKKMAKLNKKYRGKSKPTDVLSFEQPQFASQKWLFLGDMVLCPSVIRFQAKQYRHKVKDELALIVCHGLLHLLGFDHVHSKAQARKMAKLENKILKVAGFSLKGGLISR